MIDSCRSLLLVTAVAAIAACASQQPDVVRATTDVTYPPTLNVDVLDQPPAKPYTEIGVIDAPGEAGALRAQVIAQIRDKARAMGADAIILKDVSRMAPTTQRLNPTTGYYETVGGQLIPAFKGVAIKYR